MPVCDGCGAQVSDAHIRDRIVRLELASRFRPFRIKFLLFAAAPPVADNDFVYRPAPDRANRSLPARMFFDELAIVAGVSRDSLADLNERDVLAAFQRQGIFLAYAVECPVPSPEELSTALDRLAPAAIRRIQKSYQPKHLIPIGAAMSPLLPLLEMSGLQDVLVLSDGGPFDDPFLGDPQNQAEFNSFLGDRIARSCAALA
ncbi:MAG: hypothetical protein WBS18_12460 [Candidatus Acidiferrales bacterium]